MKIPANYLPVMPYLIIHRTADFLAFAKAVFSAEEQLIVPGNNGAITHGEIRIHDAVIMFAEANENWTEKTAAMFLYVTNVDNVFRLGVENGATALEAPAQKDYGYTAGLEDPFGNHWYIVQPE